MTRLVLTGASGYIGKRLAEMAQADGHHVIVLGRTAPEGPADFFPWTLGEAAPPPALAGADALVHLAHSWSADSRQGDNFNAGASQMLAQGALAAGVPRFVFASTTSARPNALNGYGRAKYATESSLAALSGAPGRVVSARIALVYGGIAAGQYGLMRKITRLTPILPMLGLDREVQPIHLDEVCRALLALALNPSLTQSNYVVAGPPIRFGAWLKMLHKVQTGGRLLLIPIPLKLVLLACAVLPFLPRERVLGLAGAEAMPSDSSLKALGLTVRDPFADLMAEERQSHATEARALLRYLGAAPTAAMERDLQLGLERAGLAPLGLSAYFLKHPAAIALIEPPANRQTRALAKALHLASLVTEAYGPPGKRPDFLHTAAKLALDLLALPVRLMARRP